MRPPFTAAEILRPVILGLALLFTLVGLVARGRWRLSRAFLLYLVWAMTPGTLQILWPDRFYNGAVWMLDQAVSAILKIALVLEVAWRTFRVFPGARSAARMALVAVLVPTALAVATVPMSMNGWNAYETLIGQAHPFVLGGIIWMICVVLAAAHVYRVPVHPFHAAVMTSFAVYLFCFAAIIRLLVLHGFDDLRVYANMVDGVAYFLLTCWWALAVWRPEAAGERAYAETVRKLQFRTPPAARAGVSNPGLLETLG